MVQAIYHQKLFFGENELLHVTCKGVFVLSCDGAYALGERLSLQ